LLQTLRDLKALLKTFDTIRFQEQKPSDTISVVHNLPKTVLTKTYEKHNLSDLKPKEELLLP
jgi:hypothetical protein